MKKNLFFLLFAILASTNVCHAQKNQSYEGSKSYTTTLGYIPGTEKYSYTIDDRGNKVLQGAYSFVGKKQYNDDSHRITASYNMTTNYKQGNLNGAYSINATYEGQIWKYIKGWVSWSGSVKLLANFADGKPSGNFTAVYKGDMNYNGTVTMKDGKYVGSYDYYGPGYKSVWNIKGQLTDKGKLTGSWKVHNITTRDEWDMVFDNDVLISNDNKKNVTPPSVQAIAKKFAAGELTEEQIKNQGYIIKKKTLPLDNFTSYFMLLDDDDFAFRQIKGWDFSDYKEKEYWEIEKPDIISEEGFEKIITAVKNSTLINDGWWNGNYTDYVYKEKIDGYEYEYNTCWAIPCRDWRNGYYYLNCNSNFHKKYGFYTNLISNKVVLTSSQYEILKETQESVALASPCQISTPTFEIFCDNSENARLILLNSDEQRKLEKQELQDIYTFLFNNLSDKVFQAHLDQQIDNYNRYPELVEFIDTCYYVKDSAYVINMNHNGRVFAFSVSMLKQLNAYQQFIQECENKVTAIASEGKKLDSELYSQISDKANSKSKNFLLELRKSFGTMYSSSNISEKEKVLQKVKNIRELYYQNTNRNNMIETSITNNFLKWYKSIYNSQQKLPIFQTVNEAEQYEETLAQTNEMQEAFLSANELYTTIEKQHSQLETLSKIYADVFKPYSAKYKTTMIVPTIESTNDLSAYVSHLESLKEDQQTRMNYINMRKESEQLNNEIITICASSKNCKRLYTALYKALSMTWNESEDNISIIKSNVKLLTAAKERLEKQNLAVFDTQMKKVKKVEEFKTALGL